MTIPISLSPPPPLSQMRSVSRSTSHSLCTMFFPLLFLLPLTYQSSDGLSPLGLCSAYTACKRESLSMEDHCALLETIEGKPKRRVEFVPVKNERVVEDTSICGVDLHPEYSKLRKHLLRFRREVNRCIAESLITFEDDTKEKVDLVLLQYCAVATASNISDLSSLSSSLDCWKAARFAQRKCSDLRRCCEPAMFCEQKASRSRNGRAIVLLKEEIGYRLADCRSMRGGERHKLFHKLDAIRGNPSDEERKKSLRKSIKRTEEETIRVSDEDKIVIRVTAPLPTDTRSLCSPYISCANNLSDYRLKCIAAQGIPLAGTHYDFHLAYLQVAPLDQNDAECREEMRELIEKTITDHNKVGEYMAECVMIKEEGDQSTEMDGCNEEVFSSPSPPIISSPSSLNTTCRVEEAARKVMNYIMKRCHALRACCVPAKRCEESAVYGELAQEFISSSIDLRANMNGCYKKRKERRGIL